MTDREILTRLQLERERRLARWNVTTTQPRVTPTITERPAA